MCIKKSYILLYYNSNSNCAINKIGRSLFVPRDNVIFCRVACPVPSFRAEDVILNLSNATIRASYTHGIKAIKNVVFQTSDSLLLKMLRVEIFGIIYHL